MEKSNLTEVELDVLCAIKYLSDDRRAKALPTLSDIAIFLRGSDLSRRKAFTHKYDLYGKYEAITNDEVKSCLDALVSEKLVRLKGGYSLAKEGTAIIAKKRPEALDNPYIKVNEAVESGEEYQYIGQYACYYRLDVFKKKTLNELLDNLEGYHSKVSPYPLEQEQIRAWGDCYNTLQECFKTIPKQYENLYVVFEYVLPNHKPGSKRSEGDIGIRSDVVLVSNTSTLVLEFKQRRDEFEGFVLQAKKYKTRLERYHEQARNMRNFSVLVLTKAKKHLKKHDGVTTCSKDYLSDVMQIIFENDRERHNDIKGWLHSPFID